MGSETDKIIEELFEGLEESMKGSEFNFDGIDILYYNLNKISLHRG